MRRLVLGAAALFALGAGIASSEEIKIGFISPMSGASATYGVESFAGVKFALDELKRSGALGDLEVTLIPADSTGNPGVAAQAAQRLVQSDQVTAILAGATSAETQAVIEVTKNAQVPQLSPFAQDTKLTQQGNQWFARICQSAEEIATNLARWVKDKHKAETIYILARNDNYGQSVADALEKAAEQQGTKIVGRVAYEPTGKDFKPLLAELASTPADFVAIIGFYTDTGLVVKQMGEMGIDIPTFANSAPGVPQFIDIAGPASDGVYGALYYFAGSIETPSGKSFVESWNAKHGREPSQFEGMGYDAMMVLGETLKRAAASGTPTRQSVRDALFTIKDFPGATGNISILENGDVERPMPFVQLNGGKLALDFVAD